MIRAIIIEDELDAQDLLLGILKEYCQDINIVGIASNVNQGIQFIENKRPDLIFLDINLGDSTGFQLLDQLADRSFKLIITTAYQEYALEAFKYQAIDYLLKPYSPKVVVGAVERVLKLNQDAAIFQKLQSLLSPSIPTKISLPTAEGILLINIEEVIHIEADRSYSKVYLDKGENKLVSKSLKEIEELLPQNNFYRLHASHLININKLEKYIKEDGGFAVMSNGLKIPIARRRKNEFLELIKFNPNT